MQIIAKIVQGVAQPNLGSGGNECFETCIVDVVLLLELGDAGTSPLFGRVLASVFHTVVRQKQFRLKNAAFGFELLLGDLEFELPGLDALVALDDQLQKLAQRQVIGPSRLNRGCGTQREGDDRHATGCVYPIRELDRWESDKAGPC